MAAEARAKIHSGFLGLWEALAPVARKPDSKFLDEGKMTHEEFVLAGDELVGAFPTWSWQQGDATKGVSYLPPEKQFLIARNMSCTERVSALSSGVSAVENVSLPGGEGLAIDGEDENEWIATNIDEVKVKVKAADSQSDSGSDSDSESEDIPDMDLGYGLEEGADPATVDRPNVVKCRTYNVMITYDRYYQCPKVWLSGLDENRQPLTPEQIFEDVSAEHAHRTVTFEKLPQLGIECAFIHPCKHSEVMKKLVQQIMDSGRDVFVEQYLFIFLKFISSVIPTINFDFTTSVETGHKK